MSYNKSYHGYFEGYSEREMLDENGKSHIERVYTGSFYCHDITDEKWKGLRLRFALCGTIGLLALIVQGVYSFGGAASEWYVGGPVGLATLALLWLLYALACYILNPRYMRMGQYRGREMLKTTSNAAVIAFAILGAGQFVLGILHHEMLVVALLCAAADAMSCLLFYRIYREESAMVYREIKNTALAARDSYDIGIRHN